MEAFVPYVYIWLIILAWGTAHGLKYVLSLPKKQRLTFREQLFASGGMPSSHSAIVTAVAAFIGLSEGIDSAVFGLALALVLVVTYDAAHVRRMAGITAQTVNTLSVEKKDGDVLPPVYRGHTVPEVFAGIALGVVLAVVVFFATK